MPSPTSPPTGTIALLIEISRPGGAVKVWQRLNNGNLEVSFVGSVGIQDVNDLVLVPWTESWEFYAYGKAQVRYVSK